MYEGVDIELLMKAVQECDMVLVQSFDSYVLLDRNNIEVYASELLPDVYTYCVGYLIDMGDV